MSDRARQRAWRALCTMRRAGGVSIGRVAHGCVLLLSQHPGARWWDLMSRIGESAELFDDHSPLSLG